MRVLIVTPEFPPDSGGGISTYYKNLVIGMREHGADVTVARGSAFTSGADESEFMGARVLTLESNRFGMWHSRFARFQQFPMLRRHLAAAFALHEQLDGGQGFDAIEVTDWGMQFVPWVLSDVGRVHVQLHGSCGQIAHHEPVSSASMEGDYYFLLERALLSFAASVASYGRANAFWWQTMLQRDVTYCPPPLAAPDEESQAPRDGFVTFGRIQKWKGPHVLCRAWERLGESAPPLVWYGRDTPDGERGQSTSATLTARFPRIWGRSLLPHEPISPADGIVRMAAAKCVVIPSTWDVFNYVTAEAMSAGCVVIVSDGAGAADLIESGVNGFTFRNGDADDLAARVSHVVQLSGSACRAIGDCARETICEQLDPARVAELRLASLGVDDRRIYEGRDVWNTILRGEPSTDSYEFLNAIDIRDISRHVVRRLQQKVAGLLP
jgi:glycosyltransferase involved in cell wall biosynthesis